MVPIVEILENRSRSWMNKILVRNYLKIDSELIAFLTFYILNFLELVNLKFIVGKQLKYAVELGSFATKLQLFCNKFVLTCHSLFFFSLTVSNFSLCRERVAVGSNLDFIKTFVINQFKSSAVLYMLQIKINKISSCIYLHFFNQDSMITTSCVTLYHIIH